MSLYLDQKYLTLISNRLPLFAKKNDNTYNCRCIICGDSVKKASKARGYFYPSKNRLMYKCHNCDASMQFSTFLKQLDTNLYNEYSFEEYQDGKPFKSNSLPQFEFQQPQFKTKDERLLDKILTSLDKLDADHEAVQFCEKRKIPKSKFSQIYFIENIKDIVQLNDKYKESVKGEEPRIVFPFYDDRDQLAAVTCRAIRGEALRYITVKVKEEAPLIYGLDSCKKDQDIFVVEGPIDSLFLDNAIAVGGTSLAKLTHTSLPKDKLVVIFDNQPRNKEVCKIIKRTIDQEYKVVIWPQNIEDKDINDMVLAGINIKKIVKDNVYSGLEAVLKFTAWKRV